MASFIVTRVEGCTPADGIHMFSRRIFATLRTSLALIIQVHYCRSNTSLFFHGDRNCGKLTELANSVLKIWRRYERNYWWN